MRTIYSLFLTGKTPSGIAKCLMQGGIPPPAGKAAWQNTTVESILKNEKYRGDALLEKMFTVDFLTKKMNVEEGEIEQYYVEGSHPAIIDRETFDRVEAEFERRRRLGGRYSGRRCLSSKIVCGDCGGLYGSKVWYSNTKYHRIIWRCNRKYDQAERCRTPHVREDAIKVAFVEVFNRVLADRGAIITSCRNAIAEVMDTTALEQERDQLTTEIDDLSAQMKRHIWQNAREVQDQPMHNAHHEELASAFQQLSARLTSLDEELLDRQRRCTEIEAYLNALAQSPTVVVEFDEQLWSVVVATVTVQPDRNLAFLLQDGTEHFTLLS